MHASFLLYSFYLFLHSLPIVTESAQKSKGCSVRLRRKKPAAKHSFAAGWKI